MMSESKFKYYQIPSPQLPSPNLDNSFNNLMASALLIVVTIVMTLILLATAFYLLVLYIHPDDKGWGTAWYCKVLVIVGLVLCWSQALLVPLDVANNHGYINSGGLDMKTLWFIIYILSLVMITCLLPYAIFFYETDPEKSMINRLLTALMFTLITLAVVCVVVFVTWAFLKYVDLPVVSVNISTYDNNGMGEIVNFPTQSNDTTIRINSSVPVYIMAILSFVGWILLILFGGVGMFSLPFDLMRDFKRRPRIRKTNEMRSQKDTLVNAITNQMKQCVELKEQEEVFHKAEYGFFEKIKKQREFDAKMSEFKSKYMLMEEEYETFRVELEFEKSNPIIPWLKLFLGIIFFLTAILWVIQLIFGLIAKKNGRPLIPFLNQLFIYMENHNAGFVATFLYAYFILYLVWAVQKGNIKFSQILPSCCKFHPMIPNGTWMNSFLFNVILLLMAAAGVTQLAASCFPTYVRNTAIYTMFGVQINYMHFYKVFYTKNIFPIAFVVWIFIAFFVQLYFFVRPPKFIREKLAIRAKEVEMKET